MVDEKKKSKGYQEGGLTDDGTEVEPTTGNEVPPGSMDDEVKDDIPARLSEGEYVLPADVVRFIGLGQIESLVQQAKQGLQQMEANGRIGGTPVNDQGVPLEGEEELTPEEMQMLAEALGQAPTGMNEGGLAEEPYQLPPMGSKPKENKISIGKLIGELASGEGAVSTEEELLDRYYKLKEKGERTFNADAFLKILVSQELDKGLSVDNLKESAKKAGLTEGSASIVIDEILSRYPNKNSKLRDTGVENLDLYSDIESEVRRRQTGMAMGGMVPQQQQAAYNPYVQQYQQYTPPAFKSTRPMGMKDGGLVKKPEEKEEPSNKKRSGLGCK